MGPVMSKTPPIVILPPPAAGDPPPPDAVLAPAPAPPAEPAVVASGDACGLPDTSPGATGLELGPVKACTVMTPSPTASTRAAARKETAIRSRRPRWITGHPPYANARAGSAPYPADTRRAPGLPESG